MFAKLNYDAKFESILEGIERDYGTEIFDIEGIGKQLDISEYGRKFFSNSKNIADDSVDANANVDDVTVVAYENESVKPLFRLNSLYLLWKELTKLYGEQFAKEVVESQILGDVYINDLSGVQKPYSYHKDTIINVKINNTWYVLSMEDLFNRYKDKVNILDDREEIYLGDLDIEVYDETKSTKLLYVLRHKNHTALKKIETKHGEVTIVTDDHPIILEDSTEILARDLNIGDKIKLGCPLSSVGNYRDIDLGYFLGFFVGDGQIFIKDRGRYITIDDYEKGNFESVTSGGIVIHQKDVKNSKIFNVCKKLFGDNYTIEEDRQLIYTDVNLALRFLDTKLGSRNRALPSDILQYDRDTLLNIVAGIIDSEGTVGENGIITIRVTSYSLAQQIGELLRILGIGKIRVSLVNNTPQSKYSYKSNYDLYRIGLRLKSFDIVPYSVKLQNSKSIYKEVGKDGRFETSEVLKIAPCDYSSEYVYDITTTTGHFYSQGMIQHNCYNFSAYDVMTKGLPFVKKVDSKPPKYLSSFCGQMVHFTSYASNQVLGAVGIADLLIVMSYYVKKELELLPSNPEYVWRQVKQEIQSLIYSMNQPLNVSGE